MSLARRPAATCDTEGMPSALRREDASFASVLAAAQRGEPWACTHLWVEHAPAVAAFLNARGSREPEDLTSDVFCPLK